MFVKYMHLERYGNEEAAYITQGILTKHLEEIKETRKDIFNG